MKDAAVQTARKSMEPVTSTPKKPRLEDSFDLSELDPELDSSYVPTDSSMECSEPPRLAIVLRN